MTGRVIKDILLIDFQIIVWNSPALDLHHFFQTLLNLEFKLHQVHTMVVCLKFLVNSIIMDTYLACMNFLDKLSLTDFTVRKYIHTNVFNICILH